ncbi:AMP-binding protein [Variovorax sp. V35]
MDLVSLIDEHARIRTGKECLRSDKISWSYGAFSVQTRKAASALQALGVGAGDRVGLMCLNTSGFVLALFAAWRLGAVVVPINHKLQTPEVNYILGHAEVKLCVVDGQLAHHATAVSHKCLWIVTDSEAEHLQLLERLVEQADPLPFGTGASGELLAEILYTSGTTGKPKGCLHTHRNVFMTALCTATGMSITDADKFLIAMPIWHASPLNNWLLGVLMMGGTAVLLREYSPEGFVHAINTHRTTLVFGSPIAFLSPLGVVSEAARHDLGHVRAWVCGGGPLSAEVAQRLIRSYRMTQFFQVYGMTETGPLGTLLPPSDALRKAGSIGYAGLPGVSLRLQHASGRECASGEVGEILLRSPASMQGYLNDSKAYKEAFDDQGFYRTGDLARRDDDGYLFIVDRARDMIVTGGENVYSKEVEDALSEHPEIAEVAVLGIPHVEWGETVVAVVAGRAQTSLDAESLRAFLAPRLARYKIPRIFYIREAGELPRTATGKVRKHVLRDELTDR